MNAAFKDFEKLRKRVEAEQKEVATPATESEVAEAIRWAANPDAMIIRKLAFERDSLKQLIAKLKSEVNQ